MKWLGLSVWTQNSWNFYSILLNVDYFEEEQDNFTLVKIKSQDTLINTISLEKYEYDGLYMLNIQDLIRLWGV